MKKFISQRTHLFFILILSVFLIAGCGGEWLPPTAGIAPTVTLTIPANGATAVSINRAISASFSKAMDPLTITDAIFIVEKGGTAITGTVSYFDVTAVFKPSINLDPDTEYTATITTGAKDLAGNALASGYTWTFTTGVTEDLTRPRVIGTIDDDGATNVPTNTKVGAMFSEAMDPLTITDATFIVEQGGTAIAGDVAYLGVNAVFTPLIDLNPNTEYTATITSGAEDLAGNQLAGNQSPLPAASDYVWSFTTGATPDLTAPLVTFSYPEDDAEDVALNSTVTATFDEAMDPLTITTTTFTVRESGPPLGSILAGVVSYDLINRVATFTPSVDLDLDTEYTATITTEAEDMAGNLLVVPAIGLPPNPWTFTTGDGLAPGAVPLGRATTFGIMATGSTASTGDTMINGDVALNPGSSQGIPPLQVNGEIHVQDQVAIDAQTDLTAAYNFAWAQGVDVTMTPGDDQGAAYPLGMAPGVYWSASTMLIQTPLTLDAGGNVDAVWIFQIGSSLTTFVGSPGGNILLANGAQAKNVFFVPVAAATIGVGTTFNGNILAGGDVTGETGATINGRLLAGASGAGVISLDGSTVNVPAP
ncbi:MAG: Ig-like domain-containing protein [Desulfatitalea sp.]|nr:Ig-like domain-containing protein [Desulfatitalea sp.]